MALGGGKTSRCPEHITLQPHGWNQEPGRRVPIILLGTKFMSKACGYKGRSRNHACRKCSAKIEFGFALLLGSTAVYGINDSEVMSGNYTDSSGYGHCFTLSVSPLKLTTITDPKGTSTSCYSINSSGTIAGGYALAAGFSNGFVYQNGVFTDIVVPTATAGTVAFGVNDNGAVVGYFADNVGTHGFLFNGPTYTVLNAPGATATFALGINNSNLITLQSFNSSGVLSSWVLNGSTYTALNVPGAVTTGVHSINNKNEIAFAWTDSENASHGAIFAENKYFLINDPAGTNTSIDTVNDNNMFVGHFQPSGAAQSQGFLAVVTN